MKTAQNIWDGEMTPTARQHLLTSIGIPLVAAKHCAEKAYGNFGQFTRIRNMISLCLKYGELKAEHYYLALEEFAQRKT